MSLCSLLVQCSLMEVLHLPPSAQLLQLSQRTCARALQYENQMLLSSQMDHQKFTTYQTLYENVQQSQDSFAISAGNKADI